jgi:hypothetical protein
VRLAHAFLQQRLAQELTVRRHILDPCLDEVVEPTRHHVALQHLRNRLYALLEGVKHLWRGAIQHHLDKHQQRHIQQLRIELRRVPHDIARFVQLAHALQASGRGQVHPRSQFDVADPPIALQLREDLLANLVQHGFSLSL